MAHVLHDKGISRLPGIDGVTKGRWHLGFTCPACGGDILCLDDPSNGTAPSPIIGDGKFSVPCRGCKSDSLIFGTADLHPIQAKEDVPAEALKRRAPSKGPRQPLMPKFRGASPTFGPRMLERRPECATIIARAISTWSYVEIELALLLSSLLGIQTEQGLAVFLSIQSGRTQFDVLNAAATVVLTAKDLELFHALMNLKGAVEKDRNAIVHGAFGISEKIPNGVVWREQQDSWRQTAEVWNSDFALAGDSKFTKGVFVFQAEDLEAIAQSLEWLHDHIGFFRGYLLMADRPPISEERYRQLCAEPRLAKELRRMRSAEKKNR